MSRFFEELPKYVFLGCLTVVVLLGAIVYGALAQSRDWPPISQIKQARDMLSGDVPLNDQGQSEHLQPNRGQGSGVIVNTGLDDQALIFMTGFFEDENQARLIKRDGTLVHKWSLDYFEHFPDTATRPCELNTPLFVDTHGALVTRKGELVFNYEYCGVVKLDYCGQPLWVNGTLGHHSMIRQEEGGYLALGRELWLASDTPDRFPPFSSAGLPTEMQEDTLLWISEDGEVTREVSIPVLMKESGLEAILTATGLSISRDKIARRELVHANKVAELSTAYADAYPMFEAGDLAISIRELNLIFVIDPDTLAVKWHQVGPWLRQHDPEFRPDGRLSIFNNNTYRTAYPDGQTDLTAARTTNIIVVDPETRRTEVIFGEQEGQEMLSIIRGQHELLPNDGMIITEFDAGRLIEVNAEREIVWEYVNEYDTDFVGELINADVYPADYFETDLPTCPS